MKVILQYVRKLIPALLALPVLLVPFSGRLSAQTIPSAGLQQLTFISVPNWATSGTSAASFDELGFNRVTGVMYIADSTNHGATAIDTKTWSYIGTIVPPGCATTNVATCKPSSAQVAPDLQKLVLTTRDTNLYIYDLRAPGQAPVTITVPGSAPDEMDYDPINQRMYIGNTNAPFSILVVDVAKGTLLGQIPFPFSIEKPRFNPLDGFMYVNSPTAGLLLEVDPAAGPFGAVFDALKQPGAVGDCANGVDIDPTTDYAFMGCSTGQQATIDLRTGAILATYPFTGADVGAFDAHNRRWYMGADNRNTAASVTIPCPKDSTGRTGTVQVISDSPTTAQLIGVACGGRGGNRVGVDPILNNVYAPVVQYPPDPNSADTGRPGILVFHDPAATVTGTPAGTQEGRTQAVLTAAGGSGVTGTLDISLRRRNMDVEASLTGLSAGSTTTRLVITTTVGNEAIPCGVDPTGKGFCAGDLLGDPLIGGVALVGSNGVRVASGPITLTSTFATFIPLD